MSQPRLNTFALTDQLLAVIEAACLHPGVNAEDPTYPEQGLQYWRFQTQKVHECQSGLARAYAFPSTSRERNNSTCDYIKEISFVVGIAQASDSEKATVEFRGYWNRLRAVFGMDGGEFNFSEALELPDGEGGADVVSSPWNYGDLGISAVRTFGGDQFRRIAGACSMWAVEMVVTFEVHVPHRKTRRIANPVAAVAPVYAEGSKNNPYVLTFSAVAPAGQEVIFYPAQATVQTLDLDFITSTGARNITFSFNGTTAGPNVFLYNPPQDTPFSRTILLPVPTDEDGNAAYFRITIEITAA